MSFPNNPSDGDAYSLLGVRWYYDGEVGGWYRSFVGADGQRIKSYAPLQVFNLLVRVVALEEQLEEINSKTFLELE